MKKKLFIFFAPLIVTLAVSLIFIYVIIPWGTTWVIQKITTVSHSDWPVEVEIGNIDVSFLRANVEVTNIKINPKNDFSKKIEEVNLGKVTAQFDPVDFITGQLRLSLLEIDGFNGALHLDPLFQDKSPPSILNFEEMFRVLNKVPIYKIRFKNSSFLFDSLKANQLTKLQQISLLVEKDNKSTVHIRFKTGDLELQVGRPSGDKSLLAVSQTFKPEVIKGNLDSDIYITPSKIQIKGMLLNLEDGLIQLTSTFKKPDRIMVEPEGEAKLSMKIPLGTAHDKLKNFMQSFGFKAEMHGNIEAEGQIEFKGNHIIKGELQTKTKDVLLDKFSIGMLR